MPMYLRHTTRRKDGKVHKSGNVDDRMAPQSEALGGLGSGNYGMRNEAMDGQWPEMRRNELPNDTLRASGRADFQKIRTFSAAC